VLRSRFNSINDEQSTTMKATKEKWRHEKKKHELLERAQEKFRDSEDITQNDSNILQEV
jgi:hypothetical protein